MHGECMLAPSFRESNAELGGLFVTVVCLYVANLTGRVRLGADGLMIEAIDGDRFRVMRVHVVGNDEPRDLVRPVSVFKAPARSGTLRE